MIKFLNFVLFYFSKGNDVFSNLSKSFFNPIKVKRFFLPVLSAFARSLLNLHVPEVR